MVKYFCAHCMNEFSGITLSSGNFGVVTKPNAKMIVGEGIYLYKASEVWHLLDSKVGLLITKVDNVDLLKSLPQ